MLAVVALGTVKFFKPEKGWGAIVSPELPEGWMRSRTSA
jgi:hypothetical protein